jgi:hypothetical protein
MSVGGHGICKQTPQRSRAVKALDSRREHNLGTDTCNIAMATYMRSYGETEERMHDLRAIYVNLSNFKGWRQFVRVCWGSEPYSR